MAKAKLSCRKCGFLRNKYGTVASMSLLFLQLNSPPKGERTEGARQFDLAPLSSDF